MVAGAGDDASPRPNFDKSPASTGNVVKRKLTQCSNVAQNRQAESIKKKPKIFTTFSLL